MIIECVFSLAGEWSVFPWLAGDIRCHPDSSPVFVTGGSGALCGHSFPPERRYGSFSWCPIVFYNYLPYRHTVSAYLTLRGAVIQFSQLLMRVQRNQRDVSTNCQPVWSLRISHWAAPSLATLVCVLQSESCFCRPQSLPLSLIGSEHKELFRAAVKDG